MPTIMADVSVLESGNASRISNWRSLLLIALTCALATAVAADDCIEYADGMKVVGSAATPGAAADIDVAGTHAFVADGAAGLQILDVAVPAAPQLVGGIATPAAAVDVEVVGGLAYVALAGHGLAIVDVTDPIQPALVSVLTLPGSAGRIAVAGDHALIAAGAAGLQIVSIDEPGAPAIVGEFVPGPTVVDVVATGAYACIVANEYNQGHVLVVDISAPTAPVEVGALHETGDWDFSYLSLARSGDHLYTTAWEAFTYAQDEFEIYIENRGILRAIDLGDPANPQFQSRQTMRQYPLVHTAGDLLLLTTGAGLMTYDIGLPGSPQRLGSLGVTGGTHGVAVVDGTALVAVGDPGIRAVDVTDPTTPMLAAGLWQDADAFVAGADLALTAACSQAGSYFTAILTAVDVSDPLAPVPYIPIYVDGYVENTFDFVPVVVGADRAVYQRVPRYGGPPSLWIWDLSGGDPGTIGELPIVGDIVALHGDLACVVGPAADAVACVDIADPSAPTLVGSVAIGDAIRCLAAAASAGATYLYAGTASTGVAVVDVTDPTSPLVVGASADQFAVKGLSLGDGDLYVLDDQQTVRLYSAGQAGSLPVTSQVVTPGAGNDLVAGGAGRLYVADGAIGMEVFDFTIPAEPRHLGGVQTDGAALRVYLAGGFPFLAMEPWWRGVDAVIAWPQCDLTVAVDDGIGPSPSLPSRLTVYPNPFNPRTTVAFTLVAPALVHVDVYDLKGRRVAKLLDRHLAAGPQAITWNGRDDRGRDLPTGTYLVRLVSGMEVASRAIMLLR